MKHLFFWVRTYHTLSILHTGSRSSSSLSFFCIFDHKFWKVNPYLWYTCTTEFRYTNMYCTCTYAILLVLIFGKYVINPLISFINVHIIFHILALLSYMYVCLRHNQGDCSSPKLNWWYTDSWELQRSVCFKCIFLFYYLHHPIVFLD